MKEEIFDDFNEFNKEVDSITCIREVCETDDAIKDLFNEPEIHNGIFYAERFRN